MSDSGEGEVLPFSWDYAHVAFSVLISFAGAISAVELNETRRLCPKRWERVWLAIGVSFILGTIGIWAMHFSGMAALLLYAPDGSMIEIRYEVGLTLASWAAAVAMEVGGVAIVAFKDPFFSATNYDKALSLVRQELRDQALKTLIKRHPLRVVALLKVQWIVLGGVIAGAGVSVMHYLGIGSQVMDATPVLRPGIITLSVFLAIFAATAAFWILFRLPLLYWDSIWLRLSSAATMTLAVCSMHYTGMHGVMYRFAPGASERTGALTFSTQDTAFAAIFITISFYTVITISIMAHLRMQLAEMVQERRMSRRTTASSADRSMQPMSRSQTATVSRNPTQYSTAVSTTNRTDNAQRVHTNGVSAASRMNGFVRGHTTSTPMSAASGLSGAPESAIDVELSSRNASAARDRVKTAERAHLKHCLTKKNTSLSRRQSSPSGFVIPERTFTGERAPMNASMSNGAAHMRSDPQPPRPLYRPVPVQQ